MILKCSFNRSVIGFEWNEAEWVCGIHNCQVSTSIPLTTRQASNWLVFMYALYAPSAQPISTASLQGGNEKWETGEEHRCQERCQNYCKLVDVFTGYISTYIVVCGFFHYYEF